MLQKIIKGCRRRLEGELFARKFYPENGGLRNEPLRFGVISYMPSCNAPRYANLGDEFQSLAATRFLPRVDAFIPRNNLARVYPRQIRSVTDRLLLIMAARFYGKALSWPPPDYIQPLFVGFRVEPEEKSSRVYSTKKSLRYLARYAPLGCRDLDTCRYFENLGLPTVLTGCLTLTLERARYFDADLAEDKKTLAVDLPDEIFELLPKEIQMRACRLEQELPRGAPQSQRYRAEAARKRLKELASAHLVITTRLHATLPCVAFGTPVVLVDIGQDVESRISGLETLFHYFRFQDPECKERFIAFPWLNPPANPDPALLQALVNRSITMLSDKEMIKS